MFWVSPILSAIVFLLFSLYFLVFLFLGTICSKNSFKIITLQGKLSNLIIQYIAIIQKINMTNSFDRAYKNWSEIYSKKENLVFKNQNIYSFLHSLNDVFPTLCFFTLFFSVSIVFKNSLNQDVGSFLIFFSAFSSAIVLIIRVFYSILNINAFSRYYLMLPK